MSVSSYNITDPNESTSDRALRRKMAQAMFLQGLDVGPIQHWTQGAAKMAQAVLGGLELRQLDQETKAQDAKDRALILSHPALGGGTQAQASPGLEPGSPKYSAVVQALMPQKVYSNDELSPLDPPSGQDRDLAIRTMLAEAGNQGPQGLQAVGSVIRNRAAQNIGGDDPTSVVTARNQFEPWITQAGRQRMAGYDPNSPAYQQAGQALDRSYFGDDPTKGATNFFAPKAQAALGRPTPAWAAGREGQDIGDHRFYGGAGVNASAQSRNNRVVSALAGQPDPMLSAGANPAPLPERVTQSGSQGRQVSVAGANTIPPEYQNYIRSLVQNPRTRAQGLQLLNQFSAPKEDKTTYGVIGQDQYGKPQYGWIDPRTRSAVPANAAPGAQAQGAPVVPPPPPGVDPDEWRKLQTKNYAQGQLPPASDDVSNLRKEVRNLPSVKNLTEVAPRIDAMRHAIERDNRAADLTLIYGLMKVQDPTSVVRESEAEMAQNIATLPQKYRQQVESFFQGKGRLAPEVREAMLNEAIGLGTAHYQQFENDVSQYRGIVGRRRMDEADVIPTFKRPEPYSRAGDTSGQRRGSGADVLRRKYGLE